MIKHIGGGLAAIGQTLYSAAVAVGAGIHSVATCNGCHDENREKMDEEVEEKTKALLAERDSQAEHIEALQTKVEDLTKISAESKKAAAQVDKLKETMVRMEDENSTSSDLLKEAGDKAENTAKVLEQQCSENEELSRKLTAAEAKIAKLETDYPLEVALTDKYIKFLDPDGQTVMQLEKEKYFKDDAAAEEFKQNAQPSLNKHNG